MTGWLILGTCLVALFTFSIGVGKAIAAGSVEPPAGDPTGMRDAADQKRMRTDMHIVTGEEA